VDGTDGKCILVVDDDRHLQVTLGDYLRFVGFEVMVAGSGEEALRKIKARKPDLVILDISMPGMGGVGFLKETRTADGSCKYPVLVLTARSAMEEFFGNVEVEGFLAKPCPESVLERKIRQILARKAVEMTRATGRGSRILVGENNRQVVQRLGKAIEKAQWRADFVHSGPDLLRRAAATPPDAILVKEGLPGMAGHVVAPLIKAMPSTANVPVIVYDPTGTLSAGGSSDREPPGVAQLISSDEPKKLIEALRQELV